MGNRRANLVIRAKADSSVDDLETQAFDQLIDAGMPTDIAAKAAHEIAHEMIGKRDQIVRGGGTMNIATDFEESEYGRPDVIESLDRITNRLVQMIDNQARVCALMLATASLLAIETLALVAISMRAVIQ